MIVGSKARWLRMLALVASLVLLTAACDGGEEPQDPGAGSTDAPSDETPAVETIEEGVLTVGSDIPYPPFEFREKGSDEPVGLDMDLINEIASRLGLEAKIVDTDFDTIFTQLATGRFDVVIAASTITEEREKQVNFSDAYYNSQQSLTVNPTCDGGGLTGVDAIGEGTTIGVQSGTTGETYAKENFEPAGAEIKAFPEGPDAYAQLQACQLDGVVNDEPTALAEIEAREGLEMVETIDTGEAYGIAVDPQNEELLDAVNETLAEIIEDGTYEEIYGRYEDLPPGGSVAGGS